MARDRLVQLTEKDRDILVALLDAGTTEQRIARRVQIVLEVADGATDRATAAKYGCQVKTVALWRRRWLEEGLEGLKDTPGRGRKRTYDTEREAAILAATLQRPEAETHWSTRRIAPVVGASKSTVQRIWARNHVQPHRQKTFKYSNDPDLVPKVIDIVGLYLHPPENAVVLCVDEKTQIQALNRTQPLLPMKLGKTEARTHDYVRNGTSTLFAALDVATGRVFGQCMQLHRHDEFLTFLRAVAREWPRSELHLVMDNYATHKHPAVKAWLARHPRIRCHFTPTSGSWLNQVETWFGILTKQAIVRGSFDPVAVLVRAIKLFIEAWNERSVPFRWVKQPDEILAKAVR